MAEESRKVLLNVYDLSCGLARQFSTALIGKLIEGLWHTGIVVYGNEYYYGGGIQCNLSGNTPYGTPIRVIDMGITHIPEDAFKTYLMEVSPRYTAESYSLLGHNCNNFSNEVAQFLVGSTIPDYILQLPNELTSTPIGTLMLPVILNLEPALKSSAVPKVPEFRYKERTMSPTSQPILDFDIEKSAGRAFKPSGGGGYEAGEGQSFKSEDRNATENSTSLADKPAAGAGQQKLAGKQLAETPLNDALAMILDEISCEFASIMATGKFHASEAAAVAASRVMRRYGNTSSAGWQD